MVFVCPRPPRLRNSSNGGLLTAHGNFTPPRISPSCPHLLRRFYRSTLWPDRSIIIPIACYRRTGGDPVSIAGRIASRGYLRGISAQPAKVAYAHHPGSPRDLSRGVGVTMGTYLTNVYSIVKVQSVALWRVIGESQKNYSLLIFTFRGLF